jgi:hypothetical protein
MMLCRGARRQDGGMAAELPETALASRGRVVTALLLLVAVGAATLLSLRPPEPEPVTAPAGTFSAARAMDTVTTIAGQPRPLGSPASDEVRDLLVARLRAERLDASVTTSVGANNDGGEARVGRVDNIVATLPGTAPTGAVVIAAHYDSVAAGPGAADDGAAVAAALETVRALRDGPPLRNDLVVLLTDGEENGLLGAQAFVRDDPLRGRPAVVLNWEARGVSGPSLMFQTSPGNARLVELFAAAAPYPSGDSSLVEAYRFMPNDTDLSEFLDAGRPGMNFAFIEGVAHYHTPGDNPANLSAPSLQHHGSSMLALAAALGATDLAPFDPAISGAKPAGDATYFDFLGAFVTYPDALVVPIAVLALLAVVAAALVARRRGLLTLPRLLAGAASLPIPVVLAGLLAQGLWLALVALRPAYGDGRGFLQRPLLAELAVLALAVLALAVWGLLLHRRVGAWALGLGAALWLAVLGVVTAVLVSGVSFLFALPAWGLGVAVLVATALRGAARPVVVAVGAVPLVVLMLPFVLGLFDAAGMSGAALPAAAAVLLGAPFVVIVAGVPVRWPAALVPLVAVVALAGAGLVVDRPDPAHPQRADLAYLLDADTGTAHWISRDLAPAPWTAQFVPAGPDEPGPALPWAGTDPIRSGPAPALPVPAPAVTSRPRADSVVEMTVTSPRGARTVGVASDVGILEIEVTLAGQAPVTLPLGGRPLHLLIGDVPADGVRLMLRPAAPGPVRLDVRDETVGLESVPGFVPRPPELSRSGRPDGDTVVVTTSVTP